MSRRTVGLLVALLLILAAVSSASSSWQWHRECQPLFAAARNGDAEAVRHWIERHPVDRDSVHYTDALVRAGLEALYFDDERTGPKCCNTDAEITKIFNVLVDGREDPNDVVCEAVFHRAAARGYTHIVEKLLERGIAVDRPSRWGGETALMRASLCAQPKVVELLLKHGADPNRTTEWPREQGWVRLSSIGFAKEALTTTWDHNRLAKCQATLRLLRLYGGRE